MLGKCSCIVWLVCVVLIACTPATKPNREQAEIADCQIIYDAGSKGTRLYVYEKTPIGWKEHSGPRLGALADPARGIRGKTMADAEQVVNDIVSALEDIRHDGPLNKKSKTQWQAFDWTKRCDVRSVMVFATAGMRLAEQQSPRDSEKLWNLLNQKLRGAVSVEVSTRTLSGFEEGLFAWLALRQQQSDNDFGVAEMGGASMQVTFPCQSCESARQIMVDGQEVKIYSHSFFGWGQDETWERLGSSPECRRGVGIDKPDWQEQNCSSVLQDFETVAFNTRRNINIAKPRRWYLSDAFRYMKETDVDAFCRNGVDSGFEPLSSCFRAIYLKEVLDVLGLSEGSEPSDINWTLGAVVCTDTQCLEPG